MKFISAILVSAAAFAAATPVSLPASKVIITSYLNTMMLSLGFLLLLPPSPFWLV
jgi:hypothetical protein